jgi:hypothetical protein
MRYAVLSQTDMMPLALTVSFYDEHETSKASSTVTADDSMM